MSGGLDSAWIKFDRATSHAVDLQRGAVAFLNAHPEPTFTVRFEGEVRPGAEGACAIYVDRGCPDPPNLLR
jgi:hypothetical protein